MTSIAIYIGDYSIQIDDEIKKLISAYKLINYKSIHIDAKTISGQSKLSNACHSEYEWSNHSSIFEASQNIMNILIQDIKEMYTIPSSLLIVCDFTDGLCSSIHSMFLQLLKFAYPEVPVIVLCIVSPVSLHGIGVINAVMASYYSLQYSYSVIFRDLTSTTHLYSTEPGSTNKVSGINLSDMIFALACDVFVFLSCLCSVDGLHVIERMNSSKLKIYDIRSSFWRLLRQKKRKNIALTTLL